MSSEPKEDETYLVGTIGSSDQRYYWADTPKGKDAALKWMEGGTGFNRVFRVTLGQVDEMTVTPPVPARLIVKIAEEQSAISGINRAITDLMNKRKRHEEKIRELSTPPPDRQLVILAARHLDETGLQSGDVLRNADVQAILKVVRFVAAHKDCEGK